MKRLTAEEVCKVIELITLFSDDQWAEDLYALVHHREEGSCCRKITPGVKSCIEFSRKIKDYWENANKTPSDPTKNPDLHYPRKRGSQVVC